jgi:hypothetical protein
MKRAFLKPGDVLVHAHRSVRQFSRFDTASVIVPLDIISRLAGPRGGSSYGAK